MPLFVTTNGLVVIVAVFVIVFAARSVSDGEGDAGEGSVGQHR